MMQHLEDEKDLMYLESATEKGREQATEATTELGTVDWTVLAIPILPLTRRFHRCPGYQQKQDKQPKKALIRLQLHFAMTP